MLARRISLLAALVPMAALAQALPDAGGDTAPITLPEQSPPEAAGVALVTVPALTPVVVRIEDSISSNQNRRGDRFRITVDEDVRIGDVLVIPAGSTGEGEVVHAAKSGAGGKAGELILAARFVRVGDAEVRLRSLALGARGKDHTNDALAAGFAIGPFAMFVKGGIVTVPAETLGLAKTAQELMLPAVVSPTPLPAAEDEEANKGGAQ
ncbi:MAG TPA: hypothetical protein VFP37_16270 [Steroidobacteraceae bacterium]|nr:hypothetical protein [Steroidobacteraceae bacterium]